MQNDIDLQVLDRVRTFILDEIPEYAGYCVNLIARLVDTVI
jgi:hypothetical protein